MRVVLAEDMTILRRGLVSLLEEEGHQVIAAVGDAEALVAAVRHDRPDVVVTDVRMPPTNTRDGVEAAVSLRREYPGLPVLIFSQYIETEPVSQLLALGSTGVGYLLKERILHSADFLEALDRVVGGGTVLDPDVVTRLVRLSPSRASIDILTTREQQVLHLMAEGRSNKGIADALSIAERSVEKHVANIFSSLELPLLPADNRRVLAVLRYFEP
jgi:DNA-binding NarL/FixJ family response regulator